MVASADAATGINKQINFQGKLVDNSGLTVADSTYTVVFSLYNVSSGGSAIWTETDSVTTKNGIFQVALGANTSLPGNVDFNSDTLYLGIKVGADLEMTPRIRFTAVPYAFNAAALDGVVATQSATGFSLQGGTSTQSTLAVTTDGTGLTFQPGVAEGLTVQSNGANGLTLDTGGGAAIDIGTNNATSIAFGKTANNTAFTFNNGSGGFTVGGSGTVTLSTLSTALGLVYTSGTNGQLSQIAPNSGFQCLQSNSGNSALQWVACNSSTLGTNFLQLINGALSPFSSAADLLLGSTATNSASFAFTGVDSSTPVASIAAVLGNKNGLSLNGSLATIQSLNNSTLTIGGSTTGNIVFSPLNGATGSMLTLNALIESNAATTINFTGSNPVISATGTNSNLSLAANGNGTLLLKSTYQSGVVIGAATGGPQAPLYINGGIGNNSALIVNNTNSGDLIDASASGAFRFGINNNGVITLVNGETIDNTTDNTIAFNSNGNGALRVPIASAQPTGGTGGDIYYDSTVGKFQCYQSGWVDCILGANIQSTTDNTSTTVNTTEASVLSGSITPSKTSSEIWVIGTLEAVQTGGGTSTFTVRVVRGASCSTGTQVGVSQVIQTAAASQSLGATLNLVDSPSTSSSTTYNLCVVSDGTDSVINKTLTLYEPTGGQAAGIGSLTVAERDSSTTVPNVATLDFGPLSNSTDQFSLTNLTGGAVQVTLGSQVGLLNAAATATRAWNFSGGLGVGTASPIGMLDVRGNSATSPVASLSGTTTAAGLLINNNGTGDILTASSGGVPHFTIQNNGAIVDSNYTVNGGLLYSTSTGVFNQLADIATGSCLTSAGATAVPTWTNCSSLGTNYLQLNSGALSPFSNTADLLIGATATSSAKFAFMNVNSGTPTASLSAGLAGGVYLSATGTLSTTNRQTLSIGNSVSGNIVIDPNGTSPVSIGQNSTPNAELAVHGTSGTLPVITVSGNTANAGLAVSNSGAGDLFTASSSSSPKFTIQNNGTIIASNYTQGGGLLYTSNAGVFNQLADVATGSCLASNGAGAVPAWVNCSSLGTNYLQLNSGTLSLFSNTADLLLGNTATSSAKFGFINVNSGTPTASISANTANNATYLAGNGILGTTDAQTLQLGSASTGNVSLFTAGTTALTAIANGNVGIGTTAPTQKLDVNGNLRVETLTNTYGVLYTDNSGTGLVTQTAQGGAGTLCLVSTNGGQPTFGSCSGSASTTWSTLTSPTQDLNPLQMSTHISVFNWATGTGSNNLFSFTTDASANGTGALLNLSTGTGSTVAPLNVSAGSKQALYINASGNVGVGTTSPNAPLQVNGAYGSNAAAIINQLNSGDILDASQGGVLKFAINNSGAVSTGTWQATTIGSQYGGTGADLHLAAQGNIPYFSGTGVMSALAVGTAGQCLETQGASANPQWATCAQGDNVWQLNSGAVSPFSNTADLLIGATATSSAKFAVINVNSGTPQVKVAATGGTTGITLGGDGSIQSIGSGTMTIGGNTTGTIALSPNNGSGLLTINANATTGISINGTSALSVTCTSAQALNGFTSIDGLVTAGTCTANAHDIAESYYSSQSLQPGDVVETDPTATQSATVQKTTAAYSQSTLGIISTKPQTILGGDDGGYPVALVGRVPAKVTLDGGTINVGDYITTSATSGFGMKAEEAGKTIGTALESTNNWNIANCPVVASVDNIQWPADDGNNPAQPCYRIIAPDGHIQYVGKIMVFANLNWYDPKTTVSAGGNYDLLQNSDLSVFDQPNNTASTSGALQTYYTIKDGAGIAVTSTTAFEKATIANIQAGAVIAKQISTDSLNVTTDNITLGGQTIHDYIANIVKEILSQQKAQNTTVFVSVNGLTTASESAQITSNIETNSMASTSAGLSVSNDLTHGIVTSNQITGLQIANAGLQIISPIASLSAQTIAVDTVNTTHIQGLTDLTAASVTAASISAQTITADTINARHIAGLDVLQTGFKNQEARITDLESLFATASAVQQTVAVATDSVTPEISGLPGVTASATVSGDLRVQGNGLVEGILHVADTLFANNVIVNGISDFFGNTIFHNNVAFEKTPTFNSDTAGIAVIKKGYDHVDITFSKPYDETPMVNASITLNPITPTPGESDAQQQQRESAMESAVLGDSIHYIITKRTVNGFTIILDKPAGEDLRFSWFALSVKNPSIFQSDGNNELSPSPAISLSPSPIDTIFPTKIASPSAGP